MRKTFPAILLIATNLCLAQNTPAMPDTLPDASFLTSPGRLWKLIWHDEFDGTELDQTKWTIGLAWGGTDGTRRHHNNLYASYIMDHNIVIKDGVLRLLTRKEDVTDARGRVHHYTEGLIQTSGKFSHTYGYWEVRAKLPTEAGPGLWPAFWTLSSGWPPEMDILEIWTGNNRSHQGLAWRNAAGQVRWDDYNEHLPLPAGWITAGMEWGPGYQIYNINGQVKKRVYGQHVPDVPHYILLNSGVASDVPPSQATIFPNAFEVDYVRVYQRPDRPVVHNGGFEHDSLAPWNRWGQVLLVAYQARGGRQALRVDGPSTAEQKLSGLKPNTTYLLSGWAKLLTASGDVRLGVKNYGGDEAYVSADKTEYQPLKVEFTTGPQVTTATIYCFVPDAAAAALFDDIQIEPAVSEN